MINEQSPIVWSCEKQIPAHGCAHGWILRKMNAPLSLHPKSRHTFSIHRHTILLVLRQYESKSYESFTEWLDVAAGIVLQLQLKAIPHFATLQRATIRISEAVSHVAVGRFIQTASSGKIFAGVGAAGLKTRHATPHYTCRCNLRHTFAKMSAGSDVKSQLTCAAVIRHYPLSRDVRHFLGPFSQIPDVVAVWIMALDRGYGAEPIRKR